MGSIGPNVEQKIITIRGQKIILDCDVAALYGVETKRINEAVKIIEKGSQKDTILN